MKHSIARAGITGLLCLVLVFAVVSVGVAAPKFEPVGDVTYKFGEVMEGENVTHIFRFKNTGDDTLEIFNVKGS